MSVRRRRLPLGWYPGDREGVEAELAAWSAGRAGMGRAVSAIGPHAGWYFSGAIAWAAWRAAGDADAVVIVGGHLPASYPFLAYEDDGFDTPLGVVRSAPDIVDFVSRRLDLRADAQADNTVEVHLPLAAARFPGSPVACFRAPNDGSAALLGSALARYAEESGKRLFVMGSTDLTHYGPNYDFEPGGRGRAGFAWADEADDAVVEAFVAMDAAAALREAETRRAACSVGAAIAAMSYAKELGAARGVAVARGSSDAKAGGDSRVGYAAVAYSAAG